MRERITGMRGYKKTTREGGKADHEGQKHSNQGVEKTNIQYSDRIKSLTEEDVYRLIENSNHGEYALDTFIPVRRDTPPLLIELSKRNNLPVIKNLPIIMQVEHIQQCMDEEIAANDGKRGHALTTDNIIEIVKGLDNPRYVFFQKDNKRYCEVVEFTSGKKGEKGLAIVTYSGNKNPSLMNGFPGREYNILVTAYPPDSKYWKSYQKSENNILIYDRTKDAPQGSYGSHVPSLLSGSPFASKLSQPDDEVKTNGAFSVIQNQDRPTSATTNRSLLANALESTTQDETELTRLREYRMSIDYLNEQEAKLTELRSQIREISFGKGPRDTARLKQLQEEATKTANRINVADKKLLRMEMYKKV